MGARLLPAGRTTDKESAQKMIRSGSYRYFVRGSHHKPAEDDFKVDVFKKQKLKDYDQYLKKFQYRDALDAAFTDPSRGGSVEHDG